MSSSLTLTNQGDAVVLVSNGHGYDVESGAGNSVNPGTGGSPTAPPAVTGVIASWVAAAPDASGNPQIYVTVSATVPVTIGTFQRGECFLDHPDSSGGLAVADGTQPADGTHPANDLFSPDDEGPIPYKSPATTITASFLAPAPAADEYWRIYVASVSANTVPNPVQYGLAGATPSYQMLVTAAGGSTPTGPNSAYGREYAPLVSGAEVSGTPRGWASNPLYETKDSGNPFWEVACDGVWPAFDQHYASLGGFVPVLDDGNVQTNLATIYTPRSGTGRARVINSAFWSVRVPAQPVRSQPTVYSIWFASFDTQGNQNTIVPGITPHVTFTISRQLGVFGQEYAPLVQSDGINPFITIVNGVSSSDATRLVRCTAYWANLQGTPSYDSRFGGAQLDVLKPDGTLWSICSGTLPSITNDISQPVGAQSWAFFVRSVDINGRWNSIAPSISFSNVGGTSPVAVAVVTAGVITSVFFLFAGLGLGSAPVMTINGGATSGGSGAVITCTQSLGVVTGYTISNGGVGYTATPMLIATVGGVAGDATKLDQSSFNTKLGVSLSSQFTFTGAVQQIANLDAGLIKTGLLQVGGGSSMPGQMKVFDHLGSIIGWIGDDTGGSGYVGLWAKQARIGGSSPSAAQVTCDALGNVTFNGTLSAGISITSPVISGGSLSGASLTITSGSTTLNIDTTDILKITNAFNVCEYSGNSWIVSSGSAVATMGTSSYKIDNGTLQGYLQPGVLLLKGGAATLFEIDTSTTFTASSASAGSATLPAAPSGFLIVTISNTTRKIPYYA